MTLESAGRILAVVVGIFVMTVSGEVVDELLGVKVSGSASARAGHTLFNMAKGGFVMWLVDAMILGG